MKKLASLFALCVLVFSAAFAQDQQPISTKNKKATKYYNEGLSDYRLNNAKDAVKNILAAMKEDSTFVEAHALLAKIYLDQNNSESALTEFKKAIAINPDFLPVMYFYASQIDLSLGRYDEGLVFAQKFDRYATSNAELKARTKITIADCKFSIEAMKHPVPFEPQNMGAAINSKYDEYFPAITADGSTFLFTRELIDSVTNPSGNEDFYMSYRINGKWDGAFNIGPPLNTELNEGAPTISANGRLMIFAGCDRPDGHGSCDLYYSVRHGDKWSPARNLGSPINTRLWESQPCLSTDGRTLYFVRGSVGGDGVHAQDIYVTQLSDTGTWSVPVKLSDSINTPGREECPYIAADNQTLYFVSDGHPGFGGTDIFMSRRKPDGSWGTPKNLGYPINTTANETGIIVDPNGQLAYFSSNRPGGFGGTDIYQFALYDSVRPTAITYMKGKVYDAKTEKPLGANFSLIDLSTGTTVMQSTSIAFDGTFLVCIPLNKNYALNVTKKGYLFYSENFELKDSNSSRVHPYTINIPLQPIDTGAHIVLKNIFFPTNQFDLKPESQVELNKLVDFMNLNPTVKIEISGHTDNVGSAASNKILSENRAKSVYTYLTTHNIAADRMKYKGYGQTRPIAGNDTPEGRAQNRRTEMKIVAK